MKFKFSLRTLLLCSIAIAFAFAVGYRLWTAPQRNFERRQNALTRVGELRGTVPYEAVHYGRNEPFDPYDIGTLKELSFAGTLATDADLIHVNSLQPEILLNLSGTKISDAGLSHLYRTNVARIDLRQTLVTQAGVEKLKQNLANNVIIETDETKPGM